MLFPDAGDREVWIASAPPSVAPSDSLKSNASSVEVPVAGKQPTDTVFVWDKRSGNIATHPLKDVQSGGSWNVPTADYKDVAQVKVRVEHSGNALTTADVTLDDGRRPQNLLIDAASNGEVTFFDVKPGSLKITAKYKVKSGETKSVTQILDAGLTRSTTVPAAIISVADDVETAAPATGGRAAAGTGRAGNTVAARPANDTSHLDQGGGNTVGSIVTYLVALLFAVGIVYAAIRYGRQNQALVESKLKQLGVDIPQPGDDLGGPVDPIAPVVPAKPAPPQKIILDDAAPDPLAPIATTVSAPTVTGEPKLLSDSGDAMMLPEGETIVGREVGLGLSLVGESTVSRRHAQLVKSGTTVTVSDLGSTNGTYVNGRQIQSATVLQPGDAVQFGSVRFRYEG